MATEGGRTGFLQPLVVSPKYTHTYEQHPRALAVCVCIYVIRTTAEVMSLRESRSHERSVKKLWVVNTVNIVLMHEILRNFKK